jgi:dipeptidyl aminopeptidase/acylaminoacyl peptidase
MTENDAVPRSLRRILPLVLCLLGCAGGGTEPQPPATLTLEVEGWVERGAEVRVTARQGAAQASGLTLRADPQSAVEWLAADRARLLTAGAVTFHATAGNASGTLSVTVAVPPAVVFESAQDGARNIWRVALDGAGLLQLTTSPAEDASPSAARDSVFFLSYRVSPAAVFVVPAGGGSAARVTTGAGDYVEPSISPDGRQLVFVRVVGGVTKLYVSDRTGANARRLTASGSGVIEVSPTWSPDGLRIAFVSTLSGNADVLVVVAAGGTPIAVGATPSPEVEPSWSPDSRRLVFTRGSGGEADLYIATVADGTVTRLTSRPGVEARPAWLPDGRIVFTAGDGPNRQLHWVDPASAAALYRIPHSIPADGRIGPVR